MSSHRSRVTADGPVDPQVDRPVGHPDDLPPTEAVHTPRWTP